MKEKAPMKSPDSPAIINVNVLRGACPCACAHCPVGLVPQEQRGAYFGRSEMPLELFKDIVDQAAAFERRPAMRIHAVGEPLLWRWLPDAARHCRERGVTSWIFTSAATGSPELFHALCDNADIIEVSVNSTSREDYAATKGIDAFGKVLANIDCMSALSPRRLLVSRVQSDAALDAEFVRHWKATGKVADAFVRSYHNYNHLLPGAHAPGENAPAPQREPCLVHFSRFNIDDDGMAVVCFNELFKPRRPPGAELGNIRQTPIADIWRGAKLRAIREASLRGDYSALPGLCCNDCAYCQPLGTSRETSEHQLQHTGGAA